MAVFKYRQDAKFLGLLLAGLPNESKARKEIADDLKNSMFPYLKSQTEDWSKTAKRLMDKAFTQGPIMFTPVHIPEKGVVNVAGNRRKPEA